MMLYQEQTVRCIGAAYSAFFIARLESMPGINVIVEFIKTSECNDYLTSHIIIEKRLVVKRLV